MAATPLTSSAAAFGATLLLTGIGFSVPVATTVAIVSEFGPKGKTNLCTAIVYSPDRNDQGPPLKLIYAKASTDLGVDIALPDSAARRHFNTGLGVREALIIPLERIALARV